MKQTKKTEIGDICKLVLVWAVFILILLLLLGHIQKIQDYRLTERLDVGLMCLDKGYNSYEIIKSQHGYIFENDYPIYACNIILNYEDVKEIKYHHYNRYTQNE